jgi:hypothetical protein
VLGVTAALPWWLAGRWLADSPYPRIAQGFRWLALMWVAFIGLTLLLALLRRLRRPRNASRGPPLDG